MTLENLIANTEVLCNLDLLIEQFLLTHREMSWKMEKTGMPMICIPTIEVKRFGTNNFMIGFIDDIFNVETYNPEIRVPLKRLSWILNLPAEIMTASEIGVKLHCKICNENYASEKFSEHQNLHDTLTRNLIDDTDVICSVEAAQNMIVRQSVSNHNEIRNQVASVLDVDVIRVGANLFVVGGLADDQRESNTLQLNQLSWMLKHLQPTREDSTKEWRTLACDAISSVWRFIKSTFD